MPTRDFTIQTKNVANRGGQGTFLPQSIAVIGQGETALTYSTTPKRVASAKEVGDENGYGSPLYLAVKELLPPRGDGVGAIPVWIYPLVDDVGGVAAAGDITITGTATAAGTIDVTIAEIPALSVVVAIGDTADDVATAIKSAIDGVLGMPVIAAVPTVGVIPITARWAGESGNNISINVIVNDAAGITAAIGDMAGGLQNPDIDAALMFGDNWHTIIVNCLNYDDTTTLDKLSVYGEARWNKLVRKPFVAVVGTSDDRATRTAITDPRKTDRTNALIPVPGSPNFPVSIAARAVMRMAVVADVNPPVDYVGLLDTIAAGGVTEQENNSERSASVDAGSGTTILENGIPKINDAVTMHHPDGEPDPSYRWVVDIVKLQNILYRLDLVFNRDVWLSAPLITDDSDTINPAARKPSDAKTDMGNVARNLELDAIIDDAAGTIETMQAEIVVARQLDLVFPVTLSGTAAQINATLEYSLLTGGQ